MRGVVGITGAGSWSSPGGRWGGQEYARGWLQRGPGVKLGPQSLGDWSRFSSTSKYLLLLVEDSATYPLSLDAKANENEGSLAGKTVPGNVPATPTIEEAKQWLEVEQSPKKALADMAEVSMKESKEDLNGERDEPKKKLERWWAEYIREREEFWAEFKRESKEWWAELEREKEEWKAKSKREEEEWRAEMMELGERAAGVTLKMEGDLTKVTEKSQNVK